MITLFYSPFLLLKNVPERIHEIKEESSRSKLLGVLLLSAALPLSACDKGNSDVLPTPSASSSSPDPMKAYEVLSEDSALINFTQEYADKLEIKQKDTHFFLDWGYQKPFADALRDHAKTDQEIPEKLFLKAERLFMARVLNRLYERWASDPLFSSKKVPLGVPHNFLIYRHYLNVRYLEVLPDYRHRKDTDGGILERVKEREARETAAWKLGSNSPYFGESRGVDGVGPFDKPFISPYSKQVDETTDRLAKRMGKDPEKVKRYGLGTQSRLLFLDLYLPAIYKNAIDRQLKVANVSDADKIFDEEVFENSLKKALTQRAHYYGRNDAAFSRAWDAKKLYRLVSKRFKSVSEQGRPLDFYEKE